MIALMFKIDHFTRKSFHLEPNTNVREKQIFDEYWKKIIDQDENQTEAASMDAVSCFAGAELNRILVEDDSVPELPNNLITRK